jgi:hypothetical protein
VLWNEIVCPAGTYYTTFSLTVGAGTGYAQFGRITSRNLTQDGVIAA